MVCRSRTTPTCGHRAGPARVPSGELAPSARRSSTGCGGTARRAATRRRTEPTPTTATRGSGLVNAGKALSATLSVSVQTAAASNGSGTLDAARGGVYVTDNGVSLAGQLDIFGQPFNSAPMATAQTNATTWSGGVWNGSRWSGTSWS